MTLLGSVTVTNVTITPLPAAPLHALEIWSNPVAVAKRFKTATRLDLPGMGRSAATETFCLIRFEPTVWLVEGDASIFPAILGDDGVLTAIGGGIIRVQLSGNGWRTLLMEGGVFDAENPAFSAGCSAATIIGHVNVRLHVVSDDACIAYVPLSFSRSLIHFWKQATETLAS
jgi:heterotetrameric sarcosine oxidase gamma subunit